MSIFSRFFGRQDDPAEEQDASTPATGLTANPASEDPLSLQLVFPGHLALSSEQLANALRAYHPSMRNAQAELPDMQGDIFGLVGWDKHVIRLVGFNTPFPAEALERCVAPSHYGQEVKDAVRASQSNLLLYYAGYETSPLEQYVALAAVAGVLAEFGALAVLNEGAQTSLPVQIFAKDALQGEDALELLRSLPLTMLYCGFVKYDGDARGVWMRTFGASAFGLADFAALAAGHHEGERYFNLFNNILGYLLESGAAMEAGHTMQIRDTTYMKLREPAEDEGFLFTGTPVLVAEMIEADHINQPH